MSLASRLKKLERRVKHLPKKRCPECSTWPVFWMLEGEGRGACPACGREPIRFTLTIDNPRDDPDRLDAPDNASAEARPESVETTSNESTYEEDEEDALASDESAPEVPDEEPDIPTTQRKPRVHDRRAPTEYLSPQIDYIYGEEVRMEGNKLVVRRRS